MRTREEINAYRREWSKKNRSKCNKYHARWKAKHPEIAAQNDARFKARNPDYASKWFLKNRDRRNAQKEAYRQENKWRWAAARAERRVLESMAQPAWADRQAIAAVYAEAKRKCFTLGIPYEVDHLWPLKGKGFCGLHVHWNLRAIPKLQNRKKHNKNPLEVK